MNVATLGSVAFFVRPDAIKTIKDYSRQSKASISTHAVHGGRALAEFTGSDTDSLKFKFKLSANLGVDPYKDYATLRSYLKNGKTIKFTLGQSVIGDNLWLIKELKESATLYDKNGNITERDVEISLIEYI